MIEPKGTETSTNTAVLRPVAVSAPSSSSSSPSSFSSPAYSTSLSKQVSMNKDQLDKREEDKQTRAQTSVSGVITSRGVDSLLANAAHCSLGTSLSKQHNNTISVIRSTTSHIEKESTALVDKGGQGDSREEREEKREGFRCKSSGVEAIGAENGQMRSRCIESSSTTLTQSLSQEKFQLKEDREKLVVGQLPSELSLLNEELWRDSSPEVWGKEKVFESGTSRLLAIKTTVPPAIALEAGEQQQSKTVNDHFTTWSTEDCSGTSSSKEHRLSGTDYLNLKFINEPTPSFGEHSRILISSEQHKRDIEVYWSTSSFIKRAFNFSSNSSCIRTSFVRSFKAGKSKLEKDNLGRTIKSLVDQFRPSPSSFGHEMKTPSSSSLSTTNEDRQQVATGSRASKLCNEFIDETDQSVNSKFEGDETNELQEASKLKLPLSKPSSESKSNDKNHKIHQTLSHQSLIAQNRLASQQQRQIVSSTRQLVSETKRGCEETFSLGGNDFGEFGSNIERELITDNNKEEESNVITRREETNVREEASDNNSSKNNMMSSVETCVSKNNKCNIIEQDSKVKKAPNNNATARGRCGSSNNARLEDRRSTYCSSVGGATSDTNFDSSFSSANNCSESNNTCAMIRQYSRDFSRDKPGKFENECRHPSGDGDGDGDDSNQDSTQIDQNNNNRKKKNHLKVDEKFKERENWDKNIEFLLAVIGFAVDLGNVWRFPYICYKNGGGAFLIPYTIMFILGGLPIFYLEMSLGQYFSSGCLTVWKRVCPMAKGIGYAMCVLNFFTGLYYNTIISWAVFFFVESFTNVLPWTNCNNSWNSNNCRTIDQRQASKQLNLTSYNAQTITSQPITNQTSTNQQQQVHFSSPTKDYFEREVLQIHLSTGIDDLGYIRKPLAIYLAIVFIFIYFAIWKGVKSTGKAVWITALLPYFVLIPLLIRGVFLEGAWLGIKYYLYPQWAKIIDVDVWVEAAKQIYFSLGPGFGTLMALSSYNKFNHNCCRDTLIAASVNYFASFISGLVIFAVLGYMATIENVDISDVATEGPGLVFQVYPEGLATMRFSSMWSVLFFIMVITLGIDSTFGGLESVITGLCDEYPRLLRAHRGVFIGFLIVLIYLCSLPTTTYGGNYVIYVLESYGTSLSLLFIVLIETIIVCWLYGADRFCKNLEEMYGKMPGAYWRICWKYISPTILLIIFVAACLQELDKYHTLTNGDYIYPSWAPTVGLLMTGSSICCIPIYALYYLKTKTSGSFIERLKIAITPIGGDFRNDKGIYVDALTDKIRDTVI